MRETEAWSDAGLAEASDTLGALLDPVAPATFLRDHYGRSPLLVSTQKPGRFADLLSIDAVDAFIDGADLRAGMIDLVRGTVRVPPEYYLSPEGRVIPSAVAGEYLGGATIILPQLHESLPILSRLCRALGTSLSCHVQANAYLTPASEQGFGPHHDLHDVFVLQVAGSKNWRLAESTRPEIGGTAERQVLLSPGDCLYIPRGLVHNAANQDATPSLHISIGLIARTWADLLHRVVADLAAAEPAIREPLPPGFARPSFDRTSARARFAELTTLFAERGDPDGALDRLAADLLSNARPQVRGVIAGGADALAAGQMFRRRPLIAWTVSREDGRPALIGPGGSLAFDRGDEAALNKALSGELFGVDELRCADPAGMFRRLWTAGYLEPADGSGGGT